MEGKRKRSMDNEEAERLFPLDPLPYGCHTWNLL